MGSTTLGTSRPTLPQFASEAEHQACLTARMESARTLAGGAAHELNNILTAILGFSTLLVEQVASDAEAVSNAREVLAGGERAATLARQLLAFSGRQALSPEMTCVADVLEGARAQVEATVGPDTAFEIRVAGPIPDIRVDVERLREAFVVLASNARDAMPEGGRLLVEVRVLALDEAYASRRLNAAPGHYVLIAVSDTGSGIAPDIQDRIFDPFFTTKARGQGIGLGLSTVYGFVKQSGGYVEVYSDSTVGTTFRIYLPVFEAPPPVSERGVPPTGMRGAGRTVLVVDDLDAVRGLAADALRRAGYRVIQAASASEALYMAHNHRGPIHLLLTDVVMPGSSGVDLARELQGDRPGLRILHMSGYPDHVVTRAGVVGPAAFLSKPFSADGLLEKVAALLR